jgi:hypothetical protein
MSTKRCFVISPIGDEGTDIRRHADEVFRHIIKPAMNQCSIEPIRSDQMREPGRISEQMFRHIATDTLCIALLTGYNPNVFYELAVAQVAKRPVIILLEKGHVLPFDVKDLRCVYYDLWPTPIIEGVYVTELVEQIQSLERSNWHVPPLSPELNPIGGDKAESDSLHFFSSPGQYGTDSDWLDFLQEAKDYIWIMGVSLIGWVKNPGFEQLIRHKADEGCKIRILTMSSKNPMVTDHNLKSHGETVDRMLSGIKQSTPTFLKLAQHTQSTGSKGSIIFRQLHELTPSCFLTQTDQSSLMVQHLLGVAWDMGPMFRCTAESQLFHQLKKEFEVLWDIGKEPENIA